MDRRPFGGTSGGPGPAHIIGPQVQANRFPEGPVEQGKSLLMNGHNVGETALLLGFEFPHHFTRLFKKVTGITPTEFLGAKTDG